jgi:hypothetical protein
MVAEHPYHHKSARFRLEIVLMETFVDVLVASPIVPWLAVDIVVCVENPMEMESPVDQDGKGSIPINEEHLVQ